MNRKDAEHLLGQRVSAWTSANGEYVGVLERVLPTRPWRAVVRIDGILAPATCFGAGGRRPRRGYRVGETIEVGNSSIKPTEALGERDYYAMLERQAQSFAETHRRYRTGAFGDPNDGKVAQLYGWYDKGAAMISQAIATLRDIDAYDALAARPGASVAIDAAAVRMARDGALGPYAPACADQPGYDFKPMLIARLWDLAPEERRALLDRLTAEVGATMNAALAEADGTALPSGATS